MDGFTIQWQQLPCKKVKRQVKANMGTDLPLVDQAERATITVSTTLVSI